MISRLIWIGLVLFVVLFPVTAVAQHGTVQYSHTRPPFSLPTDQISTLLNEINDRPPVIESTRLTIARTLNFNSEHSLMHPSIREEYLPGERTEEGADIGWEFIDSTYIRHAEEFLIETRNFGDGHFLVGDALPPWSWKLEPGSERAYLGYCVMKAIAESELGSIEAWFTTDIPVQAGPGLFHSLPGLILMVTNVSSGEVYSAEKIDTTVTPKTIVPPDSGKPITSAKYTRYIESVVAENQRT
ncbi:MAG: GLPGLI family protein [Bacteroidetes bacterium]|nr:GLPGLI family protein [Bacteroidota bacterium]